MADDGHETGQAAAGGRIIGFGLNHKTAPLALLERLSFTPEAMAELLDSLCATTGIAEAFGISTCNRTEFLLLASDVNEALQALYSRVQDRKGIDLQERSANTFCAIDEDAVRHLFQVACGVDSLVVGENEILGQLRRARETASDSGCISEGLDPLLLRAIDVGRRARQTTGISRGNVSVASVAATLATRVLGDLSNKCGVVLGAGKTAEAAAFQMYERGLENLTVINRSHERAYQVATQLGATPAGLDQLNKMLKLADVVVCATGAPNFVVTAPMIQAAVSARSGQPIILLDVSVPRNIDPAVEGMPGVYLHSLEDLSQLAEENRLQREAQVQEVNTFIDEEVATWRGLRHSVDAGRLVSMLHKRLEDVRRDYVRRNSHNFGPEDSLQLDLFSSGLTRALLHDLVENLRGLNLETLEGRHRYEIACELLNMDHEKAN